MLIVIILTRDSENDTVEETTEIYFDNGGGQTFFLMPFDSQTEKEINCNLTLYKFERDLSNSSSVYCDFKVQSCKGKWKSKETEICHTTSRSNEDFLI